MEVTRIDNRYEILFCSNVLDNQVTNELITMVEERLDEFVDSGYKMTDENEGYRRSKVLYSFDPYAKYLTDLIHDNLNTFYSALNMPAVNCHMDKTEAQLTYHHDGNYYKIHNDNGDTPMGTRYLTYVYYFFKEPKQFSGGELRFYRESDINNTGMGLSGSSFADITPTHNSMVVFPSHFMHEVLPVSCSNPDKSVSRFTINGWLHRGSKYE